MKVAIPFGGGGRGCQRKSKPWGKSSASFKISTTKDSRKLMMYNAVFLFCDPPPPSTSFWIRPCALRNNSLDGFDY